MVDGGRGRVSFSLVLSFQSAPDDCTVGYTVEFVWKATSFDRMKTAINTFREYSASISGYLFHSILGHALEPTLLRVQVRTRLSGLFHA